MFKNLTKIFFIFILLCGTLYAQNIGESKFLWVHNFQFLQFDYKIGATLQATGDNCNIWVENNLITACTVDEANSLIYAGTKSSGVLRKKINEDKWVPITVGFPRSSRLQGVLSKVNDFLITEDNTVFVATDNGLFKYDTENERWRKITISDPVLAIEESGGIIYAGLGGYTWSLQDDTDEDSDIDFDMGVFVSEDGGNSFIRKSKGLPFDGDDELLAVYDISKSDGSVFATTDAGIFKTSNGGEYWEACEKNITAKPANIKVKLNDSSLDEAKMAELGVSIGPIYEKWLAVEGISNEDKLVVFQYDSLNQLARKWTCPANNIANTEALYPVRIVPGIVGDDGKYTAKLNFYTRDQETGSYLPDYSQLNINDLKYRGEPATATIIDPQKEILLVVSYPDDPNFEVGGKFITVKHISNGDTLVWSDKSVTLRGLNKDKKGILLSNETLIYGKSVDNYDVLNNDDTISRMILSTASGIVFQEFAYSGTAKVLYAGNENGVYNTTDQGKSWSLIGSSTEGLENVDIQSLFVSDDGKIYAGTKDGVFKSENGGTSWEALTAIEPFTEITNIAISNSMLYVGTPFGFFTSNDDGKTWVSKNFGMMAFINEDDINKVITLFDKSTNANPNKGIYQLLTEEFGVQSVPDFDKQPKINLVLHNIVEKGETENTTSNGNNGTTKLTGYFRAEDQSLAGNTNKGDYIYIDSKETTEAERGSALAHQLLRFMIWNQDYNEERWVSEGIAFIAERICGYPLPVAMPDFQTLIGANTVFSLIAGTPLSPWKVAPDNGDMNNRYTMVSMFFTYLYENFGGLDFIKKIINEPENGWQGIQNVLNEENIKFADIFATWTVANAINDVTQKDPITGASFGYQDSTYSDVLNDYMQQKGLGMNHGPLFGHNTSLSSFKEYKVNAEFKEGLNNWASMIRYFFPDPSMTDDPVKAVTNYWGKDLITGEPINYKINAGDNTNLRVQLIKVKGDGKKDVEDLTPLFNNEKEFSFNVLSKYEPNADTTQLKYHNMYVLISNQDSLGGAAKFIQVKDTTPPEIKYQLVQNPLYPEFLDIFISSNEKTFSDVGETLENPTIEMVFFTDTTNVEVDTFATVFNSAGKETYYIYNGRYHLTEEGEVKLVIRKLQDLPGNDSDFIVTPLSIQKAKPQYVNTMTSPDKYARVYLPEHSLNSFTYLTTVATKPEKSDALRKVNPKTEISYVSKIYQFGPVGKDLLKDASLSIKYDEEFKGKEDNLGLYFLENNKWTKVAAVQDKKQNTFTATVTRLGIFAIIDGYVDQGNDQNTTQLPVTFAISQNYPNPFNPTTEIKYQLPGDDLVSIKVYNMNGQLVTTLVDEQKSAGYHRVQWNGKNSAGMKVSSGVYLYEMKAGHFRETKKMILIK